MPFEACDATYAHSAGDGQQADHMLAEVYHQDDFHGYSRAQIQAIHSVTSDCLLPGVHLFDSDGLHDGVLSGAARVVGEMASGVVDEVTHNPLELLKNVAIGAGIGLVATALAPVGLVGAAVAGAVVIGADIAMGGNPIEQVGDMIEGVGDFVHDAGIVANPDGHSKVEIAEAREGVHEAGEFTAELAAGAVGAGLGSLAAPMARAGAVAAYDAAAPVVSNATKVAAESFEAAGANVASVATNVGSAAMERINPMMSAASRFFSKAEATELAAAERAYLDDAATQAWPGAQSARLVGDDLLNRSVIEAARVGEADGFTYALRRFTQEAEIRNYVRALVARHPGEVRFIAEEVARVGGGGAKMPGTAGIWMDEIVRHWPGATA